MPEEENLEIVRDMYAAFGRRDIPALLEHLDEYIEWEAVIGAAPHVPTAGKRVGKNMVQEFFRILNEAVTFDVFEAEEFVAQGDEVVVLGRYTGRAKSTNRGFAERWAMAMTVRHGKVVRFREYVSTSRIDAAFDIVGA